MIFKIKELFRNKYMKKINKQNEIEIIGRKYKNIPLYTDYEMKNAPIDNSEETLNEYIGRQALVLCQYLAQNKMRSSVS